MEKTIGIITLGKPYLLSNYGTFLQHLALRTYTRDLGFDSRRVRRSSDREFNKPFLLRTFKRVLQGVWHVISKTAICIEETRSVLCSVLRGYYFEREYKRLLGGFCHDVGISNCDKIVVGGDQVWGGTDCAQFGRDGSLIETKKRISYAVSADWREVTGNGQWLEKAREEIAGFSAVSVREQYGAEFLNLEIPLPNKIVRVCDPVFLHPRDYYLRLAGDEKILRKPILFCYILNIRSKEEFDLQCLIDVSKNLGVELKILGIQGAERYIPLRYRITASPLGFLRVLRDAEYVVTNSFHGACFAILFRKQFVCLSQVEVKGASQNIRAMELLQRMGLYECLLDAANDYTHIVSALRRIINYDAVDSILAEERDMSRKWLRDALV